MERKMLKKWVSVVCIVLWLNPQIRAQSNFVVPGYKEYCKINTSGYSVLPSGRYVDPAGEKLQIGRAPFGLTISPNGLWAAVIHSNAVSLISLTDSLMIQRFPDYDGKGEDIIKGASFIGAEFLSDNKTLLVGGGDKGILWFFDIIKKQVVDSIDVGAFHKDYPRESFLTDLKIDHKTHEIFVLDRAWKELICIDILSKQKKFAIPTGRIPFALSVSENGKYLLFSNIGIYDYPKLKEVTPTNKDTGYLHFPPYAAHTKEAEEGIEIDGRKIPGLGKSNHEESMTVWIYDRLLNKLVAKIPMGYEIGEFLEEIEVVGGSHPSAIVCGENKAYVSLTQQDAIAVIDLKKLKLVRHFSIKTQTSLDKYRGYFPYGIALDSKNKRIYTALLGFNAVAVLDMNSGKTLGFIPAGWGATKVVLSPTYEGLYVVSNRGLGAGPNGGAGFIAPKQGTYVGDIQLGLFQRVKTLDAKSLKEGQLKSIECCMVKEPLPYSKFLESVDFKKLPIKHIVYITKENRTYDEIFGQINYAKGDSTLSRFGLDCESILIKDLKKYRNSDLAKFGIDTLRLDDLQLQLKGLDVAPNHQKLAREFCFSDNFYCDSDASIHGHHWMMGTIPNEYVETNSANAGTFKLFSPAPGRRFPRTTGAQDPEDYNQTGGLWEALERNRISVYNFGEANEYTDVQEEWYDTLNGTAMPVPFPMPKSIFSFTSREYPGYNTNIPDQFRVEKFEEEFTKKWLSGVDSMPKMVTIQLPNDHTSGPRPLDGYILPHSYVADNDLALGRMVQFLSHTQYWKNMLIIVTEDDPQGGVDHIDAHRSVLMMISPYVKRGNVSTIHSNFGSVIHTMYQILGVQPVNQYDYTSTVLADFFTDKPDFTPYNLVKSDLRIFDPEVVMKKYNRAVNWREIKMSAPMDDERAIKNK